MYNPFLLWKLRKCENGHAVDSVFEKHNVNDYGKRRGYLSRCMGDPEFFFSGKDSSDTEKELLSKYLTVRSVFITGSWR